MWMTANNPSWLRRDLKVRRFVYAHRGKSKREFGKQVVVGLCHQSAALVLVYHGRKSWPHDQFRHDAFRFRQMHVARIEATLEK
jgi:hypothetical protein